MSKGPLNNLCCYFFDAMSRININGSAINISFCPKKKKKTSKSIKSTPESYLYQIMYNNDSLYNDDIKVQHTVLSVKIHLAFFTYRHQREMS